jgi:uncharacterized membrane-anchored protein YjiN (DUF445 family)
MSDLHKVSQKTKEGKEWRGSIRVQIDGDEHELAVRQLVDPEFHEVMSMIDRDELQELRADLPDDEMEAYRELQQEEELDDEQQERFEELRSQLEESTGDIFDAISTETFEGIRQTAKYCVVPDEEDKRAALRERASEIEREYGVKVQQPDDVEEALNEEIDEMIDSSVRLTSFTIGIQALVETVGEDEGN